MHPGLLPLGRNDAEVVVRRTDGAVHIDDAAAAQEKRRRQKAAETQG